MRENYPKLFLSIGAMKAGTTWLYSLLENHPELYFTPEKEIHFLSHYYLENGSLRDEVRLKKAKAKLAQGTTHIGVYRYLSRWYAMYLENPTSFQWYDRVFSLNQTKNYNCDFSNLSCQLDEINWKDLKSRYPNIKLIYILRDPLKRLWSHIKFHHMYTGKGLDFTSWTAVDFHNYIKKPFLWDNIIYSTYLQRIANVFNEDEFKLFFFEDLVSSPHEELRKLESFLQINHQKYDQERVEQKINTSHEMPFPRAFIEGVDREIEKQINQLQKLGIDPHPSWMRFT